MTMRRVEISGPKPKVNQTLGICAKTIHAATNFLNTSGKSPTILMKCSRNLGDTLHMLPIIKHYRLQYPDAIIAFITSQLYSGVHELNQDISPGGLFLLPNNLSPQDRLKLWPIVHTSKVDIKIVPAIFPFGQVHECNKWCHEIIGDQYLWNAGIKGLQPLGGKRYLIPIKQEDIDWAREFIIKNNLDIDKCVMLEYRSMTHLSISRLCVMLEYRSYSHKEPWSRSQWSSFIKRTPERQFIGIAGQHELPIPGMIDGRGATWRQTVALANIIPYMIGIGSGVTMLAAGAEHCPKIIEMGVSKSISMKACGYADSVSCNVDETDLKRYLL